MSTLKVEVIPINKILPHNNSDNLEIVIVNGWQVVVKKNTITENDLCVYFPIDSVLPIELSDKIGITNYLSKGRIKAIKLRGESSFGLLWPVSSTNLPDLTIGNDYTDFFGVTKWGPPLELNSDDNETPSSIFFKYTDIENYRNFQNIFTENDTVRIAEKVHGTNSRFGFVDGMFMVGSHNTRKRENTNNKYWHVFYKNPNIGEMLTAISQENDNANVICYAEIYGSKIQDLTYGLINGEIDYKCYDINVNGNYLNCDKLIDYTYRFNVKLVPFLYSGKFDFNIIKSIENDGITKIAGANNIMEGVVITPLLERHEHNIGRVILKYVFDGYLCRKNGTEFH